MSLETRVKKLENQSSATQDDWIIETTLVTPKKGGDWDEKLHSVRTKENHWVRGAGEPEDEFEKRWKREHEAGK